MIDYYIQEAWDVHHLTDVTATLSDVARAMVLPPGHAVDDRDG
ncbi:hypothetical protein [Plantactinospora alkalitolerans]|nr:hypothetical protein [Plantactinospora alkalitolerans]